MKKKVRHEWKFLCGEMDNSGAIIVCEPCEAVLFLDYENAIDFEKKTKRGLYPEFKGHPLYCAPKKCPAKVEASHCAHALEDIHGRIVWVKSGRVSDAKSCPFCAKGKG